MLLCNSIYVTAQHCQWIKGGGATNNSTDENVKYSCTDNKGNLYMMADVSSIDIQADTFHMAAVFNTGFGADIHTLLASYDAAGHMRWAKIIDAMDAPSVGLVYDGAGSIYCAGMLQAGSKHIGYDTVIANPSLMTYLAKFDTSGRLQWLRFPDPDTNGAYPALTGEWLAIDGQHHPHLYVYAASHIPILPAVITTSGNYDMVYDSAGNILSATRLPTDTLTRLNKAIINNNTNETYVALEAYVEKPWYSGTIFWNLSIIAALRADKQMIWSDTLAMYDTSAFRSELLDIAFDGKGSIYCAAQAKTFVMGQDTIYSSLLPNMYASINIIYRLDTNGKLLSHLDVSNYSNGIYFQRLTCLPNGSIAATGEFRGLYFVIGTDTTWYNADHNDLHTYGSPILTIVDTNCNMSFFEKLKSTGGNTWGNTICANADNNIFIGGEFSSSLIAGTLPELYKHGGWTDFFLMKYTYTTGITTLPNKVPDIALYPNPADNSLFLSSSVKGAYIITDLMGRAISTGKLPTHQQEIDVAQFAPGMYFLTIFDEKGNQITTLKWLKR